VASALFGLAAVCVGGRLYSRFSITRSPSIDDGFIVLALGFLIGSLVTYLEEERWGEGYHASTLVTSEIINFFHSFWATLWCYCGCLACVKMSLLFQYRKILTTTGSRYRYTINGLLILAGVTGLWTVLSGIFICWPISFFWLRQGSGKCMNTWPLFIGNGALNMFTDVLVFLSPLPILQTLHLPLRQKLALMAVFLTGGFVMIVSAIRLAVFVKSNGATDFSWEQTILGTWSFVECALAIICASVPALKPLVIRLFPAFAASQK
ncbi:hypothetical protein K461DRAFT_213423, partial [Myriangium duriaei CBS 260.36]